MISLVSVISLLSLAKTPVPADSRPNEGRCAPVDVVATGELVELHLWKRDDLGSIENGTVMVTNSCGGYLAELLVDKVLAGKSSERILRIRDELGEWCDTPMALGNRYVIWVKRDESAFRRVDSVKLLRSKSGKLAISPSEADYRGVASLITSLEFYGDDARVDEAGVYSKAEREKFLLKPGFAAEVDGVLLWKKGTYLEDLIKTLGRRPCQDEQRQK
jgi:hypothetical protein